MKKGIIVLLIAVLVAGFAFASFSGNANIQFNADLDEKDFGFSNGTSFSFKFQLATEAVKIAEGEGIHAEIEASAALIADTTHKTGTDTALIVNTTSDKAGFGAVVSIDSAKIVGENWYISILGAASRADYAKSSNLYKSKDVYDAWGFVRTTTSTNSSYAVSYTKAPGVTIGYDGYVASFGFNRDGDEGTALSATLATKSFKFADDAVSAQAAFAISKKASAPVNVGASVKGSVAIDEIEVGFATDLGFGNLANEDYDPYFAMDAKVDFTYDFVSANAYMFLGDDDGVAKLSGYTSYYKFYLDAGADLDLNKFDVPVTVSVSANNIIDVQEKAVGEAAGVDLSVGAEYAKDAITAGASANLNTESKGWDVNLYGSYAAEKFTAGGNIYLDGASKLTSFSLGAFAESKAIVDGASIGINYGLDNAVCMNRGEAFATTRAYNTNNFAADEAEIGTIGAYCKIAF